MNLYGRVGTGFRAPSIQGRILFCADFEGGVNPATNCVSVADEEKLTSFEVGVKTRVSDKVRFNVGGFYYNVDGQQIVAVGGQFNTATLLNADKTKGYGLEVDLDWAPAAEWLVTLGGSYNKTEIDDPRLSVAACGGGCTVLDPVANGLASVDGNALPHAPKWILSGIVDYRKVLGTRGVLKASADFTYHSEKAFLYESTGSSPTLEIGARLRLHVRPGQVGSGRLGRNRPTPRSSRTALTLNNLTGMTNESRTIGLEAGAPL